MDTPQLYVVRIWRGSAGFRASVRSQDDAAPHWFTTPGALADYLGRPAPIRPPGPPSQAGEDDDVPDR
jgi:hypothetical protein